MHAKSKKKKRKARTKRADLSIEDKTRESRPNAAHKGSSSCGWRGTPQRLAYVQMRRLGPDSLRPIKSRKCRSRKYGRHPRDPGVNNPQRAAVMLFFLSFLSPLCFDHSFSLRVCTYMLPSCCLAADFRSEEVGVGEAFRIWRSGFNEKTVICVSRLSRVCLQLFDRR